MRWLLGLLAVAVLVVLCAPELLPFHGRAADRRLAPGVAREQLRRSARLLQ